VAPDLACLALSTDLAIRPDGPADRSSITRLAAAAFGRDEEALLIERLREAGALTVSLVAIIGDHDLVGHVALSPVSIGGAALGRRWLGLGPLAVRPDRQRAGIGAALVQAALAAGDQGSTELIVVLGEPDYYRRFGFEPASRYGLSLPWPVPDEAFMARLATERLPPPGVVGYHPAFDATV
jgi:putative acetyltransferase